MFRYFAKDSNYIAIGTRAFSRKSYAFIGGVLSFFLGTKTSSVYVWTNNEDFVLLKMNLYFSQYADNP